MKNNLPKTKTKLSSDTRALVTRLYEAGEDYLKLKPGDEQLERRQKGLFRLLNLALPKPKSPEK